MNEKFEVGRFYRTRDKTLVYILCNDGSHPSCSDNEAIVGMCFGSDASRVRRGVGISNWTEDGCFDNWGRANTRFPNSRLSYGDVTPTLEEVQQFSIPKQFLLGDTDQLTRKAIGLCMERHNIINDRFADDLHALLTANNLNPTDAINSMMETIDD